MIPAILLAVETVCVVPAKLAFCKTELYATLRANQPLCWLWRPVFCLGGRGAVAEDTAGWAGAIVTSLLFCAVLSVVATYVAISMVT